MGHFSTLLMLRRERKACALGPLKVNPGRPLRFDAMYAPVFHDVDSFFHPSPSQMWRLPRMFR
jgi:hypothetical protein